MEPKKFTVDEIIEALVEGMRPFGGNPKDGDEAADQAVVITVVSGFCHSLGIETEAQRYFESH